ncbi:MAG: helix-turn-helix domain-containing protein [Hydrococcus sp. SU_1_0]|nr:helix-turn-helix domain-containing protein [Hydrococcus sp. SU_1_0]
MTPYDYVLQLRVKRAKKLLQSSDLPICDVALECGFGNQSHLAKHFRKKLGITPMNYRKNT